MIPPDISWQKYMPQYVLLYYVDYNSNLDAHQNLLQECIEQNSLFPIAERIRDWWDYPEEIELDEIKKNMSLDNLLQEYEENEDNIRDWLYEHDTSTPVEDLLRNTGNISCFYSLGVEIDGYHEAFMTNPWRGETISKISCALNIPQGDPRQHLVESIVDNSYDGGELRLYFASNLNELISGNQYQESEAKQDFQQIQFKGNFAVSLYHSGVGSGDFEYIDLDIALPFLRSNLFVSQVENYDLEDCFGLCGDWLDKHSYPLLLLEPITTSIITPKSKNSLRISKDLEFDRVFISGGCTAGDMDIRRHRDISYNNNVHNVLCGNRCPHCGTFWVD